MHEQQYPIIAARRQVYDSLLWQVPTIGMAAQGFLVSAAVDTNLSPHLALTLWVLASLVGIAVLHLFRRFRIREQKDSEMLRKYEETRTEDGFAIAHGARRSWFSAYNVWFAVHLIFWVYALCCAILTARSLTLAVTAGMTV